MSTDSEIKSLAIYTAILSYLISFVVHIWYHWAYSAFQWFFKPGLIAVLKNRNIPDGLKFAEIEKLHSVSIYKKDGHREKVDRIVDSLIELLNAGEIYIENAEEILRNTDSGLNRGFFKAHYKELVFKANP